MTKEQTSTEKHSQTLLGCEEIQTAAEPDASIVWLHGLGADGHDFVPIVPELKLPDKARIRFVFPHAQVRPVTINQGVRMRAWYDIVGINLRRDQDQPGIQASHAQIDALLQREMARGIASERIILAGFSQGGAMALQVGLRFPYKLAGLIALSCYLLNSESLQTEAADANRETPVFFGHGSADPVVPKPLGRAAYETLEAMEYPVQWNIYPVAHGVTPEEIKDISAFVQDHI